jgi:hypothetical protein
MKRDDEVEVLLREKDANPEGMNSGENRKISGCLRSPARGFDLPSKSNQKTNPDGDDRYSILIPARLKVCL